MIFDAATFAALIAGTVLLDGLVRPRSSRFIRGAIGTALSCLIVTALFGLFLALSGSGIVALVLALAIPALLALASNAKHAMLGEPLVFSDLALIGAIFRHPQFYLSAVRLWQRVAVGLIAVALLGVLAWLFVPDLAAHGIGLGLLIVALALLALGIRTPALRRLATQPALHADVYRHGLLPTLLLYWLRWRVSRDPPRSVGVEREAPEVATELLVVIQCESFADPVELFGDPALALPGLRDAQADAWQWGNLEVSGFGAYTMRTEYGVLFGREETALDFRSYDPFLTALGEASHALPAQLAMHGEWHSRFVHPHDLRFYGRDRIMPAAGFAELVGEERFTAPTEGRYVTDAAMTEQIVALTRTMAQPGLIYAVTIENHGPWAANGSVERRDLVAGYMHLVRNGDAMLTALRAHLANLRRPATLVFFGDHRPSIPGASVPGADRHTPYVMVRVDAQGDVVRGSNRRVDLTPAGLHHAILDAVLGSPKPAGA